jgi:hypothetical protein
MIERPSNSLRKGGYYGGDQVNSTKQELLMAKRINGSCTTVAINDTPFSTSVPMDLSYIILQPTTILDLL